MYWTLELVGYLDDAPWPATKDELIDYAIRSIIQVNIDDVRNSTGTSNTQLFVNKMH